MLPFTLRQLEIFASLCATGSFGRTSAQLGISQASVSSQIRELENQLGFSLFLRRPGKQSALTREGRAFLKDFENFGVAARALAAHRRKIRTPQEKASYRVRVGQGLFDNFIRPNLSQFVAAHPAIDIEFETSPPTFQLIRDVLGGRDDFALFHVRQDQDIPQMMQSIATVRGGIFGQPKFAGGRDVPLEPEDISSLPFILPMVGSTQEQRVLAALHSNGITPRNVVCHTPYFDVMATLLASGAGVASFSDSILPPRMRGEVVLLYPLPDWTLVWFRKDPVPDARADALQNFLFSCVLDNPDYPRIDAGL